MLNDSTTIVVLKDSIHILKNIIEANKSPAELEGFWYYVRTIAPMIGALLSGMLAFYAAMSGFRRGKKEQERKEKEKIINLRNLLLNEITNLVLHIYSQIELMEEVYIVARMRKLSKILEDFDTKIYNLTCDLLVKLNGEEIYKAIIFDKKEFSDTDNTTISLFFKCLYRLNNDNTALLGTFESFTNGFKQFEEIKRKTLSKITEEYKLIKYDKWERELILKWYKNFKYTNYNFEEFLIEFHDIIKEIKNEEFKNNLLNYYNTLSNQFKFFINSFDNIINQTEFFKNHYRVSIFNFDYIVQNFFSKEDIEKYHKYLLDNDVDIRKYIITELEDDKKMEDATKEHLKKKKEVIEGFRIFLKQQDSNNLS